MGPISGALLTAPPTTDVGAALGTVAQRSSGAHLQAATAATPLHVDLVFLLHIAVAALIAGAIVLVVPALTHRLHHHHAHHHAIRFRRPTPVRFEAPALGAMFALMTLAWLWLTVR